MSNQRLPQYLQIAAVAALCALAWAVWDAGYERIVEVGDSAPRFSVKSDSGRTLTRSDFGGKVLVLNFWATWCPPCIEEIPTLDAMQRRLASEGVVVLAVSVDRNENTYRGFLNQAKVTFQTAWDPEADISARYGTFKYPETYIINRDGKVVAKYISNRNWMDEQILREIRSHL